MPLTIDEMYAWLVVDDQGDEGIPAVQDERTRAWMPLVGADRDRMESLRTYATEASEVSGKPMALVRFTTREEVEVILPPEAPWRRPGGTSGLSSWDGARQALWAGPVPGRQGAGVCRARRGRVLRLRVLGG